MISAKFLLMLVSTPLISADMLPELSMRITMSTGLTVICASAFCAPQAEGSTLHCSEQPLSGPFIPPRSHSSGASLTPSPQLLIVQLS